MTLEYRLTNRWRLAALFETALILTAWGNFSLADTSYLLSESGLLTSSSISSGEVATLDHKVLDDSVEFASLVAKSFLFILQQGHKQQLDVNNQYFTLKTMRLTLS